MFAFFIFVFTVSSLTHSGNMASSPSDQDDSYCLLPPYPEHGRYTVSSHPSATPGERYSSVKLDISCDTGYQPNNTIKSILCIDGYWSASMHTCVRDLLGFCSVPTGDLKVEYRCLSFPGTLERSWECESMVSRRTVVRPICRLPGYFSRKVLSDMHCRDGMWDYNPICKPACGLTTQHQQLEGTSSNHLELPWHAVIYKKNSESYEMICGGSLITATKIISSAHSLDDYKDDLRPASDFVVAVNKMYSKFKDTRDRNSQYSDIDEIIIRSRYRGYTRYYEDDIAIVVVKTPFFFHLSVRPVCLDFDNDLDSTQLAEGSSGKTAHWSVHVKDGQLYRVLNVGDFSYMKNEDCNTLLSHKDREFLTKAKFCTRRSNETGSYVIYSGSGLAFLESTTQRYYLRGVNFNYYRAVNGSNIYIYTSIKKHKDFIEQHL